jgi:glycosyl transferase, family 25
MQAYVINLARSPDRRAHIMAQLDKTRVYYEFVDAVDGRDLNLADSRIVDPMFARTSAARPGVVGCALSHLEVCRKILEAGLERACVLEDDIVLPADLSTLTDAIAPYMTGAEVILLNFHSHEPCRITKVGAVALPSGRLLGQIVDYDQVGSTGAYLITGEACARMVKTALPVRTTADDWASFCRMGAIDRLRCVVPMPIEQSLVFRTTMYRRPGSLYAKVRETLADARIPVLPQVLALKRRRHFGYAIGRTVFVDEYQGDPSEPLDRNRLWALPPDSR